MESNQSLKKKNLEIELRKIENCEGFIKYYINYKDENIKDRKLIGTCMYKIEIDFKLSIQCEYTFNDSIKDIISILDPGFSIKFCSSFFQREECYVGLTEKV
jgi:hypothetical protein